jgi:indolepyruvate ferredoxin oxidoreductase alpha subunit
LRDFAAGVERVLVVEELEDILEEHIRSLGIDCRGRQYVPGIGELSPDTLLASRAKMEGRELAPPQPIAQAADLPARPPVLCPGCPHRGVFYALSKFKVVVTGDIGCYSLGVFPPLSRIDTILCMGGGVSMAHGLEKAGEPSKVVGIVGDSTFFHSGITGLLDIAYNRGTSTIIVVDNRTTAMTGHQDHPGTGRTLMGEPTGKVSIEAIGRACGLKRVRTINPYDVDNTIRVLREELAADEPSLIVSSAPCPLHERRPVVAQCHVNKEVCRECGACLKLGCPGLERSGGAPEVNALLCAGCGLCEQVCKPGAIATTAAK